MKEIAWVLRRYLKVNSVGRKLQKLFLLLVLFISFYYEVDDDSFVAYHNLQGFLQYYNADEPHYLGHVLLHRWKNDNIAFNSGTCYVVSRESIRRVGPVLQSMPQGHGRCRGVGAGGFGRFCQCIDRSGDEEDPTMSTAFYDV